MSVNSGEQKAALLLQNMPPEVVESVLGRLGPERSARLRAQMQRLEQQPEPAESLDQVLGEFSELLERPPEESPANSEPARAAQAYREAAASASSPSAPSPATPASARPAVSAALPEDPLDALKVMDPDRLAASLQGENVRTVTLVLNYLDAGRAGDILKRLPAELRKEVSLQLSRELAPSKELLQRIAQAIVKKSQTMGEATARTSSDARFKKMADMLRQLDKAERMELLANIEEHEPDTAARVKEYLYQFEDLLIIEDRSMQKVLSEIDSKSLAMALKNVSDALRDKVLNNLSKRAREALGEEMEFMGAVPQTQIEQARKNVVEVIQRLDQAGDLVMLQ